MGDGCGNMEKKRQNAVYVTMMADSLKRKERVLKSLCKLTEEQEALLREDELDQARFQRTMDEKAEGIAELNQLDEGFDLLFRTVKSELQADREAYRAEIQEMQKYIASVSDLSVKIQALERQNSERMKIYLANQKKVIRDFRVNNKTATSYYKNMTNTNAAQSYFFNQTK